MYDSSSSTAWSQFHIERIFIVVQTELMSIVRLDWYVIAHKLKAFRARELPSGERHTQNPILLKVVRDNTWCHHKVSSPAQAYERRGMTSGTRF